jgi:hypothetical protein
VEEKRPDERSIQEIRENLRNALSNYIGEREVLKMGQEHGLSHEQIKEAVTLYFLIEMQTRFALMAEKLGISTEAAQSLVEGIIRTAADQLLGMEQSSSAEEGPS